MVCLYSYQRTLLSANIQKTLEAAAPSLTSRNDGSSAPQKCLTPRHSKQRKFITRCLQKRTNRYKQLCSSPEYSIYIYIYVIYQYMYIYIYVRTSVVLLTRNQRTHKELHPIASKQVSEGPAKQPRAP